MTADTNVHLLFICANIISFIRLLEKLEGNSKEVNGDEGKKKKEEEEKMKSEMKTEKNERKNSWRREQEKEDYL